MKLLHLNIPNCTTEKEVYIELGAILAASMMFNGYMKTVSQGINLGLEGFSESWIRCFIFPRDSLFEKKIFQYFMRIIKENLKNE